MRRIIVRHKGMTFRCGWETYGHTFARPVIDVQHVGVFRRVRWKRWSVDGVVCEGAYPRKYTVEAMLPTAMEAYFVAAIEGQLAYNEAWMLHNLRSAG